MLGAIAVLVWQRRRTRLADWLLLVLFGAAYLSAVRNSNLVGLVAPAMIAGYLPWKRVLPPWTEWAAALLLVAAIAVPFARGRAFQMRYAEWKYPAGAADFLLAHHVTQPMFHTFDKGGYLVWRCWPEERSFIDGRGLNETAFADYQRITKYLPGSRELLDRYGIRGGGDERLRSQFRQPLTCCRWRWPIPRRRNGRWCLRIRAPTIFMRQPPPGVQPLPSAQIFASMEAQCQAILDHDPARPRCARSLANLFRNTRDLARARRWMDLYMQHRPDRNPADDAFYQQLSAAGQ